MGEDLLLIETSETESILLFLEILGGKRVSDSRVRFDEFTVFVSNMNFN